MLFVVFKEFKIGDGALTRKLACEPDVYPCKNRQYKGCAQSDSEHLPCKGSLDKSKYRRSKIQKNYQCKTYKIADI